MPILQNENKSYEKDEAFPETILLQERKWQTKNTNKKGKKERNTTRKPRGRAGGSMQEAVVAWTSEASSSYDADNTPPVGLAFE